MKKYLLISALLGFVSTQAHAALVAAYTFDGNASDAVRGVSGNGTATAGVTWTAGQIGGAANFNSPDGADNIQILNPIANGSTQMSISLWVNVDTNTTWGSFVKGWGAGGPVHFGLQNTTGAVSNFVGNSGSGAVTAPAALSLDLWHHVAVTYNAGSQVLYIDGAQVATSSGAPTSLTSTISSLFLGDSNVGGQPLDAMMDDLAFYDNALTAGDITTIRNNGLAGISAVPEPSTYGLIGAGAFAGVSLLRRRRRDAGKAA